MSLDVLIRQLQGALGGMRLVCGGVDSAGALVDGVGFTSAKTGTGLYTVTFTDAFAAAPFVLLTSAASAGARILAVDTRAVSAATISARNDAATLADSAFIFVALGATG